MLLSRLGMGFFGSTGISKLFSRRGKKMIVSPARNTTFFILNWPTQYKMILSKCFPKMKNVKNTGFQHCILRMKKQDVDSCRAASQPIPLFSTVMNYELYTNMGVSLHEASPKPWV